MTTIVCANCGARFKLPDGFQGHRARCSKCGASIDVDAQLAAEAEPEPAPAPRASVRERAGARGGYGARGSRPADEEEPEPKKSRTGLIIGVSIVSLALIVVIGIFMMQSGDKKPTGKETAKGKTPPAKTEPGAKPTDKKPAEVAKADAPKPEAAKPKEVPKDAPKDAAQKANEPAKATPATTTPQDKTAKKPEDKPEEARAKAGGATGLRIISSPAEIFVPKKELKDLPLAEDANEAERAAINGHIETMMTDTSAKGARARRALAKAGHKALAPLINKLREFDYTTVDGNRMAEDVNRTLTDMLMGVNAGFKFEYVTDDKLNLAIADWNARIVEVWQQAVPKWGTKEAFDQHVKERQEMIEANEKKMEAAGKK